MNLRDDLIDCAYAAMAERKFDATYDTRDLAVTAVDSLNVVALVEALEESNDVLLATFANVSDPDNHDGWIDSDAFKVYQTNCALLATIKQGE